MEAQDRAVVPDVDAVRCWDVRLCGTDHGRADPGGKSRRSVMGSSQDAIVRDRPREQWADNLRVIVIAGVIVVHATVAYLGI